MSVHNAMNQHFIPITVNPLNSLESWDNTSHIQPMRIDNFRPESSTHRPHTVLKLAHDNAALYGIFEVDDRYVRCVHTTYQSRTHRDSCVELFLQPNPDEGYFNFEWNCCGTLAVHYVTDPTRTSDGVKGFKFLLPDEGAGMQIDSTLHGTIDPELTHPIHWRLSFKIDLPILRKYTSMAATLSGQSWRANAYKCGDETSHPHWAAWSPVPALNFHLPESFGVFQFL